MPESCDAIEDNIEEAIALLHDGRFPNIAKAAREMYVPASRLFLYSPRPRSFFIHHNLDPDWASMVVFVLCKVV